MKRYTFQVTLTDEQLMGDEFWEEVIEKDSSGIIGLTDALKYCIEDQLLGPESITEDTVKLIKFEEK